MGTYTANYNLFMPSIGEQGWGDLVNENFTTIDTTMKSFSNRIGTLETETGAVEERVTVSEGRITTLESYANNGNITGNVGTFDSIIVPPNTNPSNVLIYSETFTTATLNWAGLNLVANETEYTMHNSNLTRVIKKLNILKPNIPIETKVIFEFTAATYTSLLVTIKYGGEILDTFYGGGTMPKTFTYNLDMSKNISVHLTNVSNSAIRPTVTGTITAEDRVYYL